MPIVRTRKPQVHIDVLLGRRSIKDIVGLYQLEKKQGYLIPQRVPSSKGDCVIIEKGACPSGSEQHIICDHVEFIAEKEINTWVPVHKFYLGQFVSFWTKQSEFLFQIYPTDNPKFGEFRLISKKAVVRQPGKDSRTSKTKSI